jgi:hypothetical protein
LTERLTYEIQSGIYCYTISSNPSFGYITLRQTATAPVSSRGLMCRL